MRAILFPLPQSLLPSIMEPPQNVGYYCASNNNKESLPSRWALLFCKSPLWAVILHGAPAKRWLGHSSHSPVYIRAMEIIMGAVFESFLFKMANNTLLIGGTRQEQ